MRIPTAYAIPTAADAIPSAVDALLKWKTNQSNSNNPQLLPQDDFIYLVLTLKKVPQKPITKPYKIPLPNPLIRPNSFSEICLIIDDRPNSKLTSSIAKEKITTDEITAVSKVIKFSKLKTDYKPFESKRKLCDSYELFFADKRVIPLLPKLLGKTFFHKKKLPLGLDLTHNNWKYQIQRGCSSGLLFFSTGTCCVVRVAKVSMERDEIVDNVTAALNGAVGFVPKKLAGVRSLHLKFSDSVALPLFRCLPDVKLRILGKKDEVVEGVDEVVEIVEVGKKSKSKKRIHEVNHHDDGEVENEDSISVDDDVVKSSMKKRKAGEVEMGKKKVSNKAPNATNSLCGYKIVTGQPSDRLGEDFTEFNKDFTERLTCVEDLTKATMKKLTQGMGQQNKTTGAAISDEEKAKIKIQKQNATTGLRACNNILAMTQPLHSKAPSFIGDKRINLSWNEAVKVKTVTPPNAAGGKRPANNLNGSGNHQANKRGRGGSNQLVDRAFESISHGGGRGGSRGGGQGRGFGRRGRGRGGGYYR